MVLMALVQAASEVDSIEADAAIPVEEKDVATLQLELDHLQSVADALFKTHSNRTS